MREVREKAKEMLVLDAGDLLFKKYNNPIPENEMSMVVQKAQLMIESFNRMGYDAVGIGDDDLSLGKEFLLESANRANFPFLSSNLVDEESSKLLFQPYLLKVVNGLKVGIFSLLSPDFFSGPSDPRKKGLIVRAPVETAQEIVKELQPKTDIILLLSHLGYLKDIELAQKVSGIHLIIGSHSGIHLSNPLVAQNTIVLQMASKGMYGGKLDLLLTHPGQSYYNSVNKRSLENNLTNINRRLSYPVTSEDQKKEFLKTKERYEQSLKQYQGKNEFTNVLLPLDGQMKEDMEIKILIEAYKLNFPEMQKPLPPK